MTSFNAYHQYIVQRYSKYITSQNANEWINEFFIIIVTIQAFAF